MRLLIPILLLLASCRGVQKTQTTVMEVVAIKDTASIKAYEETIAVLETEIRDLSKKVNDSTAIVIEYFEQECSETDKAQPTVKVNGGKVETTGPVRSVNVTNRQLTETVEQYKKQRDSIASELILEKSRRIELEKQLQSLTASTTKKCPIRWDIWLLIAVLVGLLIRAYWPRVLDLFIKKRTI